MTRWWISWLILKSQQFLLLLPKEICATHYRWAHGSVADWRCLRIPSRELGLLNGRIIYVRIDIIREDKALKYIASTHYHTQQKETFQISKNKQAKNLFCCCSLISWFITDVIFNSKKQSEWKSYIYVHAHTYTHECMFRIN
jgi:hypothetical protein